MPDAIEIAQGDLTTFDIDAIINMSNSLLLSGGGNAGSTHTVGTVWRGKGNSVGPLVRRSQICLQLADTQHILAIAFPATDTGAYRLTHFRNTSIALRETHRL